MGTPGFMAPEIQTGQPASVASDVYAYCRTVADLVIARGAPHWLEPLVRRGLADAPGERWARLDDLLHAIERELGIDPDDDPRIGRKHRFRIAALLAAIVITVPVLARLADYNPQSVSDAFYSSLLPPVALVVIFGLFWRRMTATAFNRRGLLTMLTVVLAITFHRGLTLNLGTSAPSVYCVDLLLVGCVLFGGSVYERDRLYVGAASVCVAAAAAVAVFPTAGAWIFSGAMAVQVPFIYFHWAAKGARAE
jgi:hypothetical protein